MLCIKYLNMDNEYHMRAMAAALSHSFTAVIR